MEQLLIVNSRNIPIGIAPRNFVRGKLLTYRASYIYIYSQQKKSFLVQKRTLLKDNNPGCFDLCVGGCFGADESD